MIFIFCITCLLECSAFGIIIVVSLEVVSELGSLKEIN